MRNPGTALFLYVLLVIAAFMLGPKWQNLVEAIQSGASTGTTLGSSATTGSSGHTP